MNTLTAEEMAEMRVKNDERVVNGWEVLELNAQFLSDAIERRDLQAARRELLYMTGHAEVMAILTLNPPKEPVNGVWPLIQPPAANA